MIKRIAHYIVYLFGSKSGRGYGIHSPFVFDFARNVLSHAPKGNVPKRISNHIADLKAKRLVVAKSSFGAGSAIRANVLPLKRVIATQSIPPKYGRMLFNLVQWSGSDYIVELGTSVGISTLYLASGSEKARVFTLEGDTNRMQLAKEHITSFGLRNVEFVQGDFSASLPRLLADLPRIDLVFFDGDHSQGATLAHFGACLEKAHGGSVFVFDDIRWSGGMYRAWLQIVDNPRVSISIDLFRMGIVFFRKGIVKQHFKIFY